MFKSFAAAGAGLFILTMAVAQDAPSSPEKKAPGGMPRATFKQLDTNADGKVSFEEVKARIPNFTESKFQARDKDGDGLWSPEEWTVPIPKEKAAPLARDVSKQQKTAMEPGGLFKRADKDSSGTLTFEEIQAESPNFTLEKFKKFDKNADQVLSVDEVPQPSMATAEKRPAGREGFYLRADENKDGKVTFEELHKLAPRYTRELFDKMDVDKDGSLSREEVLKGQPMPRAPEKSAVAKKTKGAAEPKSPVAAKKDGEPDKAKVAEQEQKSVAAPEKKPNEADRTVAMMRRADTDKNGKVTFEELAAISKIPRERFDVMDKNKDGVLSADDRKAPNPAQQTHLENLSKLLESDSDKDGFVTFDEISAAKPGFPREAFDLADRNKDGKLSTEDQ